MRRRDRAGDRRAGARHAQTAPRRSIEIKVGTLAPEGTPWYDVIQEIGAKWKKASGGQISLTIFGGGVQGDEAAMIRKMRIGQLQMGAFTTVGPRDDHQGDERAVDPAPLPELRRARLRARASSTRAWRRRWATRASSSSTGATRAG